MVIFVLAGAMGEDDGRDQSQAAAQGVDVVLVLVALAAFVALVARSRGRLRPEMHPALDLRPPVPPLPAAAG